MTNTKSALSGKRILITRTANQAGDFIREIERYGGTVIVFPTIEIAPPISWEACDRAIDALYMYDGMIFTSSNGVEFFFRRLAHREIPPQELQSKMICAVGEKTKQEIERHGLKVASMPEKFTAFDLAKILQTEDLHGKCFLFPRGNLGRDTLQDNLKILGANVDAATVYQTLRPKQENIEQLREMLMNEKIDVATFTSPSTFKNFIALFTQTELNRIHDSIKIAAIGPVTASAVREFGWQPDIIATHSAIAPFARTIADFFTKVRSEITR